MTDLAIDLNEEELLSQLPRSVRTAVNALDGQAAPWDVIGGHLASAPTAGIALKGGGSWSGTLWVAVKNEIRAFICTESSEYADLRSQWSSLQKRGSGMAVAALSGAIGGQLGVAGGVIAPLVIWALVVALRIGKAALCQALNTASESSPPVV